jgi:hypothetical protein
MAKKYHIALLRPRLVIIALDMTAFMFTHLYIFADKLSARLKRLRSDNAAR